MGHDCRHHDRDRDPRLSRAGRAADRESGRRHHPDPVHGCRAGGELRPSGHADGPGAGDVRRVAALPAVRPEPTDLEQPRPFRAVGRSRLHPALRSAPPDRGQVGQPRVRDPRRALGAAGGPEEVPSAGLEVPRAPGVPLDGRGGVHHRPAGHRHRHQRRHGDGRPVAGGDVQQARLHPVRLRRVRDLRRRLPDGGHQRRGGFAGRPPQAVQPVLDLRQQPDHHRGQHRSSLHRGRRDTVRGVRLGGPACRRRQRPGRTDHRAGGVQGRDGQADDDHRQEHHRLGCADQAGPPFRARRAARRRRDQGRQAFLRLAGGRVLRRAGRGPGALRRGHRQAGRGGAAGVGRAVRRVRQGVPRARRAAGQHAAAQLPDGWDADLPIFEPDAKGARAATPARRR